MKIIIHITPEQPPKEILSQLLEAIYHHVPFSTDENLKEYISWCYDEVYLKKGTIHKSRQKELDYILEQEGDKLKEAITERIMRGYESTHVVGGKRTRMWDLSMLKKKARPKKGKRK